MVVGEAHNIQVVTEFLFEARERNIYLWPEATRLSKSQVPTEIGTYGHYKHNPNSPPSYLPYIHTKLFKYDKYSLEHSRVYRALIVTT